MDSNGRMGLWCGRRVSPLWAWIISVIVMTGSIRGLLVINSEIPPKFVYPVTAAALLMLASYGYFKRKEYKSPELTLLKNLLKISMLMGIVNVTVDLLSGVPFEPSFLYLYLAPYIVFLFLHIPTRYFNVVIAVVTIAIGYSVISNFIDSLSGPEGVARVYNYNLKLRPDSFEAFGRTGGYLRASGYTGNFHDSANILGMAASFFFIRFLLRRWMLDLALFTLALVSLTLTQSATNIIVAILTILIFTGYILIRSRNIGTYIALLGGAACVAVLIAYFGDVMSIFTARVGADGDWGGMTKHLDIETVISSIPLLFLGHTYAFESPTMTIEIGLIKNIFQQGIIHATIFYWVLLYPIFRFVRVRAVCSDALPAVAAISFGFMSLLHYGSLFRVTSVFLFFVFYAIVMINVIHSARLEDKQV